MPDENINGTVSKKIVAEWCGISERRVQQLVHQKTILKNGSGGFDLKSAVLAYIQYLHGLRGSGIVAATAELDQRLKQAQTEEREAKAALQRIVLDQKRGDLVTIEEVKRQWSVRLVEFKAAMLEMPKRAAFRFTDADIRLHVEEELSSFVVEVLARYSRGGICAVADRNNNVAEAAPVDNGKPVGRRKQNPKSKGEPVAGAVEDKPDAVSS